MSGMNTWWEHESKMKPSGAEMGSATLPMVKGLGWDGIPQSAVRKAAPLCLTFPLCCFGARALTGIPGKGWMEGRSGKHERTEQGQVCSGTPLAAPGPADSSLRWTEMALGMGTQPLGQLYHYNSFCQAAAASAQANEAFSPQERALGFSWRPLL